MSICRICLDSTHNQYYPGDRITGKVICKVSASHTIQEVVVSLGGTEHISWQEDGAERYSDKRNFLQLLQKWPGRDRDAIDWNVISGKEEFLFKFNLPPNLPGTYEGKYGCVEYSIRATLVVKGTKYVVHEKIVTVVAPIDFNKLENLQLEPVVYSADLTIRSLCICNGMITMDVHLEKEAFVLGEVINIKVTVTNRATFADNITIDAKMWMVIESSTCKLYCENKYDVRLVATGFCEQRVCAGEEATFGLYLQLPKHTVLPNFVICKFLRQLCRLEVTATLRTNCSELHVGTHVELGHIPIGGQRQTRQKAPHPIGFRLPYPSTSHQLPYPPDDILPTFPMPMVLPNGVPTLDSSDLPTTTGPSITCASCHSYAPSAPAIGNVSLGPGPAQNGVTSPLLAPPSYDEATSSPATKPRNKK